MKEGITILNIFHLVMKARFRSNVIFEVKKDFGVGVLVVEVREEVKNHFATKFQSFQLPKPSL